MIQGVVFDLGETLISFQGNWEEVFKNSRAGLIQYLESHIGPFDKQHFDRQFRLAIETAHQLREKDHRERLLVDILADTLDQLGLQSLRPEKLDQAMEVMFGPSEAAWNPVPGGAEVLGEIRAMGVRLGLISNASDAPNVFRLMEKAAIGAYFDPIIVSAAHGWRKPAAEVFESVLDEWQLPPDQVVMIGDTLGADILGARRMGMRSIWVRSAPVRDDNLRLLDEVKPDAAVDSVDEVPSVIRTWMSQPS